MKIFVTGATGFVGSHLVPKLIERGYQVTCLVRNMQQAEAAALSRLGATLAQGDVTDRESMRIPMTGADAVLHVAAWYQIGVRPRDRARMNAINYAGTRQTLELAVELRVPKIVYTSTTALFGNTHHQLPDETYRVDIHALTTEYERTKWRAHYEVAVPLQQQGASLVIVQPGPIVGVGDNSHIPLLYHFYFMRLPVMAGSHSGLSWTHVDDVAAGHILALEKGRAGESYILAGPPLTYREAMRVWQRITDVPAPKWWLPDWFVQAVAGIARVPEYLGLQLPIGSETLRVLANYTFYGDSAKAERELGWKSRPIEEVFREVLDLARRKKN